MKCADCNKLLPSLLSGDLSRPSRTEVEAHLADCPDCQQHLTELRQTVGLLREAGKQLQLPSDFQRALHEKLRAEPPPRLPLTTRLWWFLERFGFDSTPRLMAGAALAVTLIALLLVPLRQRGEATARVFVPEETVAASFRIPSQRVAVVQLDFVADVSVDDVEFEVSLPGELEFVDGGAAIPDRQIAWKGSLSVGSNPVPVAVRGIRPGRYRVTALAKGRDVTVRHEVLLEVVPS
jgi:hypothetical protein